MDPFLMETEAEAGILMCIKLLLFLMVSNLGAVTVNIDLCGVA